jgi:HTH-type transcriptional regulator / antitoxin HigA
MAKLGWVSEQKGKALQVEELLKFFGVASPASWLSLWGAETANFRQSTSLKSEAGAIAAWLRKGEIEASLLQCNDYDERAFKQTLVQLRDITRKSPREYLPKMQEICSASGVAVVFVPEIPGTSVLSLKFLYKIERRNRGFGRRFCAR